MHIRSQKPEEVIAERARKTNPGKVKTSKEAANPVVRVRAFVELLCIPGSEKVPLAMG